MLQTNGSAVALRRAIHTVRCSPKHAGGCYGDATMASTLRRLFLFAKSENDALENFTTEALAAAIRLDADPFVAALRASSIHLPDGAVRVRGVQTQTGVEGAGILDLIVLLAVGLDEVELWFEVKCNAPESGEQLVRYRAHLAARPASLRPQLIVLAPRHIAGHEDLPLLPWQALWRASSPANTRAPSWWDFRRFLQEINMVNPFDTTITAREASGQTDTFALLQKLEEALNPVVAHATKIAPSLQWPATRKKIRAMMGKHFTWWGTFTVDSRARYRAYVSIGAFPDGESRESWAGVRVAATSVKDLAARKLLVDCANTGALPGAWMRAPSDEEGGALAIYVRLAMFESLPELSAWFIARFDELHAAGALAAIPTLGDAPDDASDDADETD